MTDEPKLRYISLGAGVQSSALYVCSELGLHGVARADAAIFADTGNEPPWVYETLEKIREWGSIPVEICSKGNLGDDIKAKARGEGSDFFAPIPAYTPREGYTDKESMLRRQCTREYKITPIEKEARRLLGYKPRQRIAPGSAAAMIGISMDEVQRMKPSRTRWITNEYPLIDAGLYRQHCRSIVIEHLGFEPQRSACVFCPYLSNREWRMLRELDREGWEYAIAFDDAMRSMTKGGDSRPIYVHRSLKPLAEADIDEDDSQGKLWDNFAGECEGMCGV